MSDARALSVTVTCPTHGVTVEVWPEPPIDPDGWAAASVVTHAALAGCDPDTVTVGTGRVDAPDAVGSWNVPGWVPSGGGWE